MNSNTTQNPDEAVDRQRLDQSFNTMVASKKDHWLRTAKLPEYADCEDKKDGFQLAIIALWKKITDNAKPGDHCAESVAHAALTEKYPNGSIDKWMACVLRKKVNEVLRNRHLIRRGQTGKEEESRRRLVPMSDEYLATLNSTQPDTSREWTEEQLVILENCKKWLTEGEIKAIDARLRLSKDVHWEDLVEKGDTIAALKKREERARRKLRTQLAKNGFTSLGSIYF